MWKLLIKDDDGRQIVVPLKLDEYMLGRKAGSRIRLVERNVSREHATLRKTGGDGEEVIGFTLEDLTSDNGTFVNGTRLRAVQKLSHGDVIQIGDYRIVLQDESLGDVTALLSPPVARDEPEYDP